MAEHFECKIVNMFFPSDLFQKKGSVDVLLDAKLGFFKNNGKIRLCLDEKTGQDLAQKLKCGDKPLYQHFTGKK